MADTSHNAGRSRLIMTNVLGAFISIAAGSWVWLKGMQSTASPKHLLADFGAVPDLTMTERSGAEVRLGDLKGHIWVANFIFTRCAGTCLSMSSKMSDLQKSLRKAGDVRLVSFSVDPKNDTPEQLSKYAESYQAEKDKWLFLRTEYATIQKLAKESFHLGLEEGSDSTSPFIHSDRFVLIDTEGHIRGYYSNSDPEANQKLLTDIGVLMRGEDK